MGVDAEQLGDTCHEGSSSSSSSSSDGSSSGGSSSSSSGGCGAIAFTNVQFAYTDERDILSGLTLEMPAGKTTALVGSSGSGKSTIARLLYRFYGVRDGAITIDGQDISELTLESVRRHIGIVPQDTVLFNESLLYNMQCVTAASIAFLFCSVLHFRALALSLTRACPLFPRPSHKHTHEHTPTTQIRAPRRDAG